MISVKDITAAEREALEDCSSDEQREFFRELFQLARLGLWGRNFVKPALEKFRQGPKALGYISCAHRLPCNCVWSVIGSYSSQLLQYAGLYEAPREKAQVQALRPPTPAALDEMKAECLSDTPPDPPLRIVPRAELDRMKQESGEASQ